MSDVIVVFGNVTSDQYGHLRTAMRDQGLKPKIIRIDQEEKHPDTSDLLTEDWNRQENPQHASPQSGIDELLRKAFGEHPLSDAKAIVYPAYSDKRRNEWEWVTEHLPADIAEYHVHVHETDGSYWLQGQGFGDSPPALNANADAEIVDDE